MKLSFSNWLHPPVKSPFPSVCEFVTAPRKPNSIFQTSRNFQSGSRELGWKKNTGETETKKNMSNVKKLVVDGYMGDYFKDPYFSNHNGMSQWFWTLLTRKRWIRLRVAIQPWELFVGKSSMEFWCQGTLISHQGLHSFPVFRQDPIDTMSESSRCFRKYNFNALQVGCVYLFIYRYTVHVRVEIRGGGAWIFHAG